ncbi:MAG TPA: ribosome assembly RNA-binding protein YhbY [Polyangiaceae bacterium]|nr:ribosome assembly RNA-binding protein YhbY [Polyangiaceae bacterium]
MHPLTSKQRANLRARAHELHPVVQLGHQGWTEAVLNQIDAALTAHELIKIKLGKECPLGTDEVAHEIEQGAKAHVVQRIGHVVVAFRRNPEKPKIGLKGQAIKDERKDEKPGAKSGRQLTRNRKAKGKRRSAVATRRKRPQY